MTASEYPSAVRFGPIGDGAISRSGCKPGSGPLGPSRASSLGKAEPNMILVDRMIWIDIGVNVGSVVKKRRKKMRKHKQRKLLKRQRHKK